MAETSQGIQGFFKGETAGLPNWAWIVVIVVGIGAAVLVPRLFKGSSSQQDTTSTGDQSGSGIGLAIDPTTGLPYAVEGLVPSGGVGGGGGATNGTGGGGGIAQPPPPASGLIPISGDADNDDFFDLSTGTVIKVPKGTTPTSTTGGTTGTSTGTTGTATTPPKTATTPQPAKTTAAPAKPAAAPPVAKPATPPAKPATPPAKVPTAPIAQYATVRAWPDPMSTLSGIASQSGISLARIEQLNPQITNPNTIYAGQKIRIA